MSIVLFTLLYALGLSIIGVLAKAIIERENKQQKLNRKLNQISEEIVSRAIRVVEERNTDDLDAMIRYFKEQEQQVRYNIKG